MKYENLPLRDCWIYKPQVHSDERGEFFEWFRGEDYRNLTGANFDIRQANCSISNKNVVRGIHFAAYPPGQKKYVSCMSGSALDVLVDLRPNSPTYLSWVGVEISAVNRWIVNIPSGVGHGFLAHEDSTVIAYLCDQPYLPSNEFGINPFDTELGIVWSEDLDESSFVVSDRDRIAPSISGLTNVLNGFADL